MADDVAFLDAPGVTVSGLIAAIEETLVTRTELSVLTVFSDDPSCRPAIADLCRRHDLALVATIAHEDRGTAFTLRRGPSGPATPAP